MSSLTQEMCRVLLDHIFTATAWSPSASVYVSLHETDPGETGAAEVAYTGYGVRPSIAFDAAAGRSIQQTVAAVSFPPCTGAPVIASFYGLWTGATGGTFLGGGVITTPIDIQAGLTPSILSSLVVVRWLAGPGLDGDVGMSNYLANSLLDFVFRNQALARPTVSVALTITACTDAGLGTECSGGDYARLPLSVWDAANAAAGGASTSNSGPEIFSPNPSADWGSLVSLALMDAASNMLFYGNDAVNQDINNGDTVQFLANQLAVNIA